MIIESFSNPKVKQLQQLLHSRKHRKESDIFVLESPKIIHECLAKNPDDIVAILCPEGDEVEYEKVPVWVLKRSLFLEVVSTVTPQPLLALVRKPKWKTNSVLKAAKRILLLDGVRDPHNIGAVLRNIKAFGMDALIVTEETVDAFHPKVCRSSAGAVMSIPVLPFSSDTLEILRKESVAFSIIAAGGTASITQLDCSEKQVFILGSEGQGISKTLVEQLAEKSQVSFHHIEMSNETESLNVAVASGILGHHLYQQDCLKMTK